nr:MULTISPECIES: DUF3265 domain-containing protein [unclassified Vibrio]
MRQDRSTTAKTNHTNLLRIIRNEWRLHYVLRLVFKVDVALLTP